MQNVNVAVTNVPAPLKSQGSNVRSNVACNEDSYELTHPEDSLNTTPGVFLKRQKRDRFDSGDLAEEEQNFEVFH